MSIAKRNMAKRNVASKTNVAKMPGECEACGQSDYGQSGEQPCPDCGLPLIHDDDVIPPTLIPESYDEKDGEVITLWDQVQDRYK